MEVLKVSSGSNPNSVAGALAGVIRESDQAEVTGNWSGSIKSGNKGHCNCQRLCCTWRP